MTWYPVLGVLLGGSEVKGLGAGHQGRTVPCLPCKVGQVGSLSGSWPVKHKALPIHSGSVLESHRVGEHGGLDQVLLVLFERW